MQKVGSFQGNQPAFLNHVKSHLTEGLMKHTKKAPVTFSGTQFGDNTGVLMPRFSGGMSLAGKNLNVIA